MDSQDRRFLKTHEKQFFIPKSLEGLIEKKESLIVAIGRIEEQLSDTEARAKAKSPEDYDLWHKGALRAKRLLESRLGMVNVHLSKHHRERERQVAQLAMAEVQFDPADPGTGYAHLLFNLLIKHRKEVKLIPEEWVVVRKAEAYLINRQLVRPTRKVKLEKSAESALAHLSREVVEDPKFLQGFKDGREGKPKAEQSERYLLGYTEGAASPHSVAPSG